MGSIFNPMAGMGDFVRSMNELADKKAAKEQERHEALVNLATISAANRASEFYQRIAERVRQFDASLDQDHEVGMRLVTFGQTITFHVTCMGFHNPSMITFSGNLESGDPVELIQHVSQISFLLVKMARPNPDQPKKPFGFAAGRGENEQQSPV